MAGVKAPQGMRSAKWKGSLTYVASRHGPMGGREGGWIGGLMDGRGGRVWSKARVGQAFLKMDVEAA